MDATGNPTSDLTADPTADPTSPPTVAAAIDPTGSPSGGSTDSPTGTQSASTDPAGTGGTGPAGAGIIGTEPGGTGSSGMSTGSPTDSRFADTDLTGSGPTATDPTATGPTSTGPTATGPIATGPTGTGIPGTELAASGLTVSLSAATEPALITPEALAESMGFGPGGLPDDLRAGVIAVPAPSDAPEFAILAPADQLSGAADLVASLGGTALRGERFENLGLQLLVVDLAGGVADAEVRALLQADGIDAAFDSNSLFVAGQGRRTYANQLVGAVPVDSCRLPRPVRIGLIDGPVDSRNPYLQGLAVTEYNAVGSDVVVGAPEHATGIASLMAAPPSGDGFGGIAPGAELLSAVAFAQYRSGDAASMESIARSVDWLLGQDVSVINMSIAGPYNEVLRRILGVAAGHGAVLVAASGNDAGANVAYPGSDPDVIAVTALDAAKRLYGNASIGDEVEFAAPGVDVLVAEGEGTAYRTGTSYAAAVLSALIAHEIGAGKLVPGTDARDILRAASEDLGETGRDAQFGWGLPRLPECGTVTEARDSGD